MRLIAAWVSGQMILWAGFQLLCVPLILFRRSFKEVVLLFWGYILLLLILAVVRQVRKKRSPYSQFRLLRGAGAGSGKKNKKVYLLWTVFLVLLLFQLIQALRLTYADWDDAFYVATSTITEKSNTMYCVLPYTGGTTGLDARHGLAPFPIWISFLSRVGGLKAVIVARVILPVVLITMTYAVFMLVGEHLFRGTADRLPLFMIFTEILVLFGNYSIYSVENFMIARSRQGKAALGSIVIPLLILLLLLIGEKIQTMKSISVQFWLLFAAAMTSACLCSTMGAAMTALLVGITGLVMAVSYRRVRILLPMIFGCVPCTGFLVLYFLIK